MSTTNVKGLKELQAALDKLPAKLEANIMRGAMRAGIKEMVAAVKEEAPEGPPSATGAKRYGGRRGLLKASVRGSVKLRSKSGKLTGVVRSGGKVKGGGVAYYVHMVNKGTKPHVIKAKKGSALPIGGGVALVNHPGAKANQFAQRGMDRGQGRALNAIANYVRARLRNKHGIDVPAPTDPDIPDEA